MGHVQGSGHFPVDGPGLDLGLLPQLLGIFGSTLQEALGAEGLAVFQKTQLGNLVGQGVNVLALGFYAPFLGNADELLRVFDLVVAAFLGLVRVCMISRPWSEWVAEPPAVKRRKFRPTMP